MNRLLRPVATGFLFNGNNILSFIFFLKQLLPLVGDQYFKKSYFCRWKPFSLIFFRHSFKWKQSFDQLKSYFSTNPSFWLVKTVFWLITNLLLWFRAFLCLWTPLLKLNVDLVLNKNIIPARWNHFLWFLQISWHQISFSWIPAGGSSYLRLVETEFPSNLHHD